MFRVSLENLALFTRARAFAMFRAMLGAKHGADMTVDDIVLRALEGGPVTVSDIIERFEKPVRIKLEKSRLRGVVVREGGGGAHRQFTYRLLRLDCAAEAPNPRIPVLSPPEGRCHVWTTPADQGFFCRVAMVVGTVMSPVWLCGDKMRPAGPDVVRVIPGPIKVSRSRSADNASGLGMGPQSLASRHSHPRFLVSRNRQLYA
jgi:hypothetical protein